MEAFEEDYYLQHIGMQQQEYNSLALAIRFVEHIKAEVVLVIITLVELIANDLGDLHHV